MGDFDYSDQDKAIAHDRDRYAWEHESGLAYAGFHQGGFELDHRNPLSALSEGYEEGFSRGWDAAMKQIDKKEIN